jgi:hypothetical protein
MERLPHDPRNLRELIEADLRCAARLLIKIQDEIDPQVRIATPEGDFWIAVTDYGRRNVFRALSLFMAWKQALGFTFASEIYQPDAVYCLGITYKERATCLARICREPRPWSAKNFRGVEWLPSTSIDPVLIDLLHRGAREITSKDQQILDKWFGGRGKFPALQVATGELGI